MASLRARLFAGLALLAVATGLAAGGLAFRWAFQEAIELQDAILVQVGELAVKNHLGGEVQLIALWDGGGGDGPGTADLVKRAEALSGRKAAIIDPHNLADGSEERHD
jgi:hypothetical protein